MATTPDPLTLTAVAVNPDPIKTTGTASFTLSAPATVTTRVLTSQGALVRSLLSSAAKPGGATSVAWDRKNSAGQRVPKGTYRLQVDAVNASGQSTSASIAFGVA